MASKTMPVSQDIGVTYWTGSGNTEITSRSAEEGIIITPSELPALLARLQEVAEAMGMETESDKEIAQLRTQLAGCSVAALGGTSEEVVAKPGSYGWSPAYTDVLNLRFQFEAARQLLESAEKRLDAAGVVNAELAALLGEMIDVFDGYELTAALPLDLREQAEKALASVKR